MPNSIKLSWHNPTYSFTPQSFKILRTNPYGHPSGSTNTFIVNSSSATGYTDTNVGLYASTGKTYSYQVAVCENTNGGKQHPYCPVQSIVISNYDRVYNLSGVTRGNDIYIFWTNHNPWTIPVNSFLINRVNPVGHPSGSSTVFIVNSSTLTGFTDTNVGQFSGTYKYQVALCTGLNGAGGQEVCPLFTISITNANSPPLLSMTGSHTDTKYYGSWDIAPQLHVSGGTGSVTVYYKDTIGASVNNYSKTISLTGGVFNVDLDSHNYARAFGSTSTTFKSQIVAQSGYTTGGTILTFTLPHRLQNPITGMSANQVGADVNLSWSPIGSDSGATTVYGYAVRRYLTSDFAGTITTLGWTTGTTYTDVSAPHGNYSYYVFGASLNGNDTSTFCSDASNITAITIT